MTAEKTLDKGMFERPKRYSEIGEFIRMAGQLAKRLEWIKTAKRGIQDTRFQEFEIRAHLIDLFADVQHPRHLPSLNGLQLSEISMLVAHVLDLWKDPEELSGFDMFRRLVDILLEEWKQHVIDILSAKRFASEDDRMNALEAVIREHDQIIEGILLIFHCEDYAHDLDPTRWIRDTSSLSSYALASELTWEDPAERLRSRVDELLGSLWEQVPELEDPYREWLLTKLTAELASAYARAAKTAIYEVFYTRTGGDAPKPFPKDPDTLHKLVLQMHFALIYRIRHNTRGQSNLSRRFQAITPEFQRWASFADKIRHAREDWERQSAVDNLGAQLDLICNFLVALIDAMRTAEQNCPETLLQSEIGGWIYHAFKRRRLRLQPEALDWALKDLARDPNRAQSSDEVAQEAFNQLFPLPGAEEITDQNKYDALLREVVKALLVQARNLSPESLENLIQDRVSNWYEEAKLRVDLDPDLEHELYAWFCIKCDPEHHTPTGRSDDYMSHYFEEQLMAHSIFDRALELFPTSEFAIRYFTSPTWPLDDDPTLRGIRFRIELDLRNQEISHLRIWEDDMLIDDVFSAIRWSSVGDWEIEHFTSEYWVQVFFKLEPKHELVHLRGWKGYGYDLPSG